MTYDFVGGLVVGDLLADQLVAPLLRLAVGRVGHSWHDERHLGQSSRDAKSWCSSEERHSDGLGCTVLPVDGSRFETV
jgi:predicted phosphoribosyltransferase